MLTNEADQRPTFTISDVESDDGTESAGDKQRCEFCNCSRTPLWRRGPRGKATLCNACGIRWSSRSKEGKADPQQQPIVNEQDAQQSDEFYQLDCRTGEAVPFVGNSLSSTWQEGPVLMAEDDGSFDTSEAVSNNLLGRDELDNLSSDGSHDLMDDQLWEDGYDVKYVRDGSAEDMSRSGEDEEDEEEEENILATASKMEAGKENYYCKYCDTSWPYNHFRNAQQFGAHCSNCSRKRKVKDPQELTIRERNKRLRKAKKVSPMRHEKRKRQPRDHEDGHRKHDRSSLSASSDEDCDISAISFLQRAALASADREKDLEAHGDSDFQQPADMVLAVADAVDIMERRPAQVKKKRKLDVATDSSAEDEKTFSSATSRSPRKSSRNASTQGLAKRGKHRKSRKKSSRKAKPVIVTPGEELDQATIASDPNSLGGLLGAIERKLTAEKKKREIAGMKQRVWSLRKEVDEQLDAGLDDLRFRSVALLQELRVDMMAKLEALKIDLASELSFRETRRKKRLNEMRIQMNALNRILESGKKDRENGLLLSTFGGKFDTALKQLEDLKLNLQKEFTTREQAMQQQFTEMRASCSLHLANIKQQMHEEMNVREGRMQKELEDMKHKLHSVCSQIGADNYCPENTSHTATSLASLSALPVAPEKFTTTTTTTTTTTITTNINTTSPAGIMGLALPSLVSVGLGRSIVPVGIKGGNPASAPAGIPSFPGCVQELKSATA